MTQAVEGGQEGKPDPEKAEAEKHPNLWNGNVELIDDHQAVELELLDGLLRRVIVCCDCGLPHLMSVDSEARKAYFVREDGPKRDEIRRLGRAAGHVFVIADMLIDADHEWALWFEKWTATVDTYTSLLEKERSALAEAEQREQSAAREALERACKAMCNWCREPRERHNGFVGDATEGLSKKWFHRIELYQTGHTSNVECPASPIHALMHEEGKR